MGTNYDGIDAVIVPMVASNAKSTPSREDNYGSGDLD